MMTSIIETGAFCLLFSWAKILTLRNGNYREKNNARIRQGKRYLLRTSQARRIQKDVTAGVDPRSLFKDRRSSQRRGSVQYRQGRGPDRGFHDRLPHA